MMKHRLTLPPCRPLTDEEFNFYLMRAADLLSDDPFLRGVLGSSFCVIAEYDAKRHRINYSFRRKNDIDPDEQHIKIV